KYSQALWLHEWVTGLLLESSIRNKNIDAAALFRKGMEELRFALNEPIFLQEHVVGQRAVDLQAYRDYLARFDLPPGATPAQVSDAVREVAIKGLSLLKLNPTVIVMEITCGSCHAIDNYTTYLTPSQIHEMTAALKGRTVGVGLKLAMNDGRLV